MKTFEEFLIEVFIERSTDANPDHIKNAARNYELMRSQFPFIDAVHDASIEAAQRYSNQNCEAAVICERLAHAGPESEVTNDFPNDEEDIFLYENCPTCGHQFDEIDYEYQICSRCKSAVI